MLLIKHKLHPCLILLGCLSAVLFSQLAFPAKSYAANITCPDGFVVQNAPLGERDAVCADHQTGTDAKDSSEGNIVCPDGYRTNAAIQFKSEICADHQTGTEEKDSVEQGSSSGSVENIEPVDCNETPDNTKDCIQTPETVNECKGADAGKDPAEGCGIFEYINTAINLLSIMIGIVVTIMIIVGGIQYSAAGGDPNAVQKAKGLIFKAVFALIGYGLLYAVMKWLLPGGII